MNINLAKIFKPHIQKSTESKSRILLLDETTVRITSSSSSLEDLWDKTSNISLLDSIEVRREPIPGVEAVYFITPTEKSVNLLIGDWDGTRLAAAQKGLFKRKPEIKPTVMYKGVYIFFTGPVAPALINRIKAQSHLLARIKNVVILYFNFIPLTHFSFSINELPALSTLFTHATNADIVNKAIAIRKSSAFKLASFCHTINEYPIIRYSVSQQIAQAFATEVQACVDDIARNNQGYLDKAGITSELKRPQATLIILERSSDIISPLLHEFTYEAMIHDLLPIPPNSLSAPQANSRKKTSILPEIRQIYRQPRSEAAILAASASSAASASGTQATPSSEGATPLEGETSLTATQKDPEAAGDRSIVPSSSHTDLHAGTYSFESTNIGGQTTKKFAMLNAHDPIWTKLKYQHISKIQEYLPQQLALFQKENKVVASLGSGKKLSTSNLRNMAHNFSSFSKTSRTFSLHIDLATKIYKENFIKNRLFEVGMLEQNMVINEKPDGSAYTRPFPDVLRVLNTKTISELDKARVLMIYLATSNVGLTDDIKKTINSMFSPKLVTAISNFFYFLRNPQLSSSATTESGKISGFLNKFKKTKKSGGSSGISKKQKLDLSRWED